MLHVQRKHLTASSGVPQEGILLQRVTVHADVTCPFLKIFSFCLLTLKPHNTAKSFPSQQKVAKLDKFIRGRCLLPECVTPFAFKRFLALLGSRGLLLSAVYLYCLSRSTSSPISLAGPWGSVLCCRASWVSSAAFSDKP